MLADERARRGERIVLADQAHGVGIAALVYQRDVAGDVHARRAQRHARHRLLQRGQTLAVADVFFIVVAEAAHALEHHVRGGKADGAVRRIGDDARRALDQIDRLQRRLAVEHALQHRAQLAEADAARHALAARLRMAQPQKRQRHVHRTESRRAGDDPALQILIQVLDCRLCNALGCDTQSAQTASLPIWFINDSSVIDIIA